jgi:hypothetical protein
MRYLIILCLLAGCAKQQPPLTPSASPQRASITFESLIDGKIPEGEFVFDAVYDSAEYRIPSLRTMIQQTGKVLIRGTSSSTLKFIQVKDGASTPDASDRDTVRIRATKSKDQSKDQFLGVTALEITRP